MRRQPAAPDIMDAPPQHFPQRLDPRRILPDQVGGHVPFDQRVYRRAAAPDRIGVADAFQPVLIRDANRHDFEGRNFAMRRIRQHDGKWYAVMIRADCLDGHDTGLPP